MNGFNHRDPDIEALMWKRAHAQGDAHNAATVLGTRVIVGPGSDAPALRQAIQECADAFISVMTQVSASFADAAEELDAVLRQIETFVVPGRAAKGRHGHAALCPRHGPTTGGLCRRCAR